LSLLNYFETLNYSELCAALFYYYLKKWNTYEQDSFQYFQYFEWFKIISILKRSELSDSTLLLLEKVNLTKIKSSSSKIFYYI